MDTKVQRSAGLGINMEHPDCGESQTNPGQAAQANGSLQSLAVLCCTVLCCANRHSFHLCYFLIFKSSIPYHKRQTTMSIPQFANFRRFVLTGSIAGVTATGAWYGAGLKMKQDIKQVFAPPPPYPFCYSSISISSSCISQTNLFFLPLHRKNKKQQKPHHSNKSPNWKPTVPT
jgi:hypothetical protein